MLERFLTETYIVYSIITGILLLLGLLLLKLYKHKASIESLKIDSQRSILGFKEEIQALKKEKLKEIARREEIANMMSDAFGKGGDMVAESSRYLEIMLDAVQRNCDPLREIVQASGSVNIMVVDGEKWLDELKKSLENFEHISTSLKEIKIFMDEINRKSEFIGEIAIQAKILSFNASIEAQRAGAFGKGFAVVAADINRLSQFSGQGARDINDILASSLPKVETVMNEVSAKIDFSKNVSEAILTSFSKMNSKIIEINSICSFAEKESEATLGDVVDASALSRTSLESLMKLLTDVIGRATNSSIIDLLPSDVVTQLDEFIIIDVRSEEEFVGELGHIVGANLHPIQADFEKALRLLSPDRKYLFVCRSGGRSSRAANMAQDLGFSDVYNLMGGMLGWQEHVGHRHCSFDQVGSPAFGGVFQEIS